MALQPTTSAAAIGFGTKFFMGAAHDTEAAQLTKLAEVTMVDVPDEQVDDVEVTHYESPNRTKEFIPGLIDAGTISLELNWVPGEATDELLADAKNSGEVRPMRIEVPGKQSFSFVGYVKGYKRTTPLKDAMKATVTIRVAGAVTQAAVA